MYRMLAAQAPVDPLTTSLSSPPSVYAHLAELEVTPVIA